MRKHALSWSLDTSKTMEHNETGGGYPAQWRGTPNVVFPCDKRKPILYGHAI